MSAFLGQGQDTQGKRLLELVDVLPVEARVVG